MECKYTITDPLTQVSSEISKEEYEQRVQIEKRTEMLNTLQQSIETRFEDEDKQKEFDSIFDKTQELYSQIVRNTPAIKTLIDENQFIKNAVENLKRIGESTFHGIMNKAKFLFNSAQQYAIVGKYLEMEVDRLLQDFRDGKIELGLAYEQLSYIRAYYRNMHDLSASMENELRLAGLPSDEPILSEFKTVQNYWQGINIKVKNFNLLYLTEDLMGQFDEERVEEVFSQWLESYEKQAQREEKAGRKTTAAKYRAKIEALKKQKPSKELIKDLFAGKGRDLNKMDFWFNALVRSSSAVVSSFRQKLQNITAAVNVRTLQEIIKPFSEAFDKFIEGTGGTRTSPKELNTDLYVITKSYSYNKETKAIEENDIVELNQWWNSGALSKNLAEWKKRIEEHPEKSIERHDVLQEFGKWKIANIQQEYKDEVYESETLLTKDALDALLLAKTNRQNAELQLEENYTIENEATLFEAIAEEKNIRYERDRNGNLKSPEQLVIAQSIDAYYKHRAAFYEDRTPETDIEAKEKYDSSYIKFFAELTRLKNFGNASQAKIDSMLKFWKMKNERREISKEFAEQREAIYAQISEVLNQLYPNQERNEVTKELWDNIYKTTRKYRDNNRQIQGEFVSKGEVQNIKKWLDEIEHVKQLTKNSYGLSKIDQKTYTDIISKHSLPNYDKNRFKNYFVYLRNMVSELKSSPEVQEEDVKFMEYYLNENIRLSEQKKTEVFALTEQEADYFKNLKGQLTALYDQLDELQVKEVTPNYEIEYQKRLMEYVIEERAKIGEGGIITDAVKEYYEPEFHYTDWYKDNHRQTLKFDEESGKFIAVMEPLYIWQEILPRNEAYITTVPAFHFYKTKVKDEYLNKNYETNPFDEKEALPKREGEFDKKSDFFKKENANKPKQEAHRFLTEQYIKHQQGIETRLRPKARVPSFEKSFMDKVIEGDVKPKHWWEAITRRFKTTELDTDEGIGIKIEQEDYEQAFAVLPVRHTPTKMDIANFDFDIWGAIAKFGHSAFLREAMLKTYVQAKDLLEAVQGEDNFINLKDENIKAYNIFNTFRGVKNKRNLTGEAIADSIKTLYFNEYSKAEKLSGIDFQKIVKGTNGIAALNTLLWNVPSAAVNWMSGRTQVLIESIGGRLINYNDYLSGQLEYSKRIHQYMNDGTKLDSGKASHYTHMVMAWGAVQGGFEKSFGDGFNKNRVKEFVTSGFWGNYIRNATEHQVQVTLWLAKLKKEHIKVNGRVVSLLEFYETLAKDHGVYRIEELYKNDVLNNKYKTEKLKDSKPWTQKDEDLLRNDIQGVNANLFGEYEKINKSTFEKTSLGAATYFFRRYLVRMVANRLAGKELPRFNITTHQLTEGFYVTAWDQFILPLVKLRFEEVGLVLQETIKGNRELSPEQVQNMRRFFIELGVIITLSLLIMMVGDDGDDLKEHSFTTLYALYFAKKVKSETEQFMPPFGFNEIVNTMKSPSIAFNQLANYRRIFQDLSYTITGNEKAYLQKDTYGYWEEGDSKLLRDALALSTGFKGSTFYPEQLIRNFDYAQRAR